MSISEMVQRLAQLGASAEMIAVAVEAVCEEQQKDEARRAKRAAQKRKERGGSDCRATVARQGSDEDATVALPPKRPPTPPKTTPPYPSEASPLPDAPAEKSAAASPALSLKDRLWIEGKVTLVALGVAEKKAGSLIGKWLRDTGADAGRVLWAIEEAQHHGTGDPAPYITRLLAETPTAQRAGSPNQSNRWDRPIGRDSAATALLKRDRQEREANGQFDPFADPRTNRRPDPGNRRAGWPNAQPGEVGGAGPVLDLEPIRPDRE